MIRILLVHSSPAYVKQDPYVMQMQDPFLKKDPYGRSNDAVSVPAKECVRLLLHIL
jgi:hypothetical protein